jgi:hypothetical protein
MMAPMPAPRSRFPLLAAALGAAGALVTLTTSAGAQIKRPGAHPSYSVEIEPHLVLRWDADGWGDEGLGVGLRATVPFLDNGPISRINNNMGIGFGLDWTHFEDPCWRSFWHGNKWDPDLWPDENCTADVFDVPVVVQWNFFLTPVISVFGEPGLEIEHTRWSFEWYCMGANAPLCEIDDSDTDVEPVFFAGGRFLFGNVGALVRLGWPYLSAGVSILL